eukprot:scaffold51813_cov27-Phaeocystis_antarctica.AAC.1
MAILTYGYTYYGYACSRKVVSVSPRYVEMMAGGASMAPNLKARAKVRVRVGVGIRVRVQVGVGLEAEVVAGGRDGHAHEIGVVVHRLG